MLSIIFTAFLLLPGALHAAPGDPIVDIDEKNLWSGGYYYVLQLTTGLGLNSDVVLSARNSTCPANAAVNFSTLQPLQMVQIIGSRGIVQESHEVGLEFYRTPTCVQSGNWALSVDGADGVARVVAESSAGGGPTVPVRFEMERVEGEAVLYYIRACAEGRECALLGIDQQVMSGADVAGYMALADRPGVDVSFFAFVNTGLEGKRGDAIVAPSTLPSNILSKLYNRKAVL